MIKVTIELESAITGKTTVLGQMHINNKGSVHAKETNNKAGRYNYGVAVSRKGDYSERFGTAPTTPLRTGEVRNYPSARYNVWRLVSRAIRSAFPEER